MGASSRPSDAEPSTLSDRGLTLRLALGALGALLLWWVVAWLLVPPVIQSAYRQEAWGWVNGIIEGRDVHPIQTYLADWGQVARVGFLTLLSTSLLILITTRGGFQRGVDRILGPVDLQASARTAAASVSRGHRRIVNAVLAAGLAASLACIALAAEVWPFSDYHMYSGIRTETSFSRHNLYGVSGGTEFPIDVPTMLPPFDLPRLHRGLLTINLWHGEAALQRALASCRDLYEKRRRAGAHDGPPLEGLRYYRLDWEVDPWARNRDQPRVRELVAELNADD